MAQTIPIVLCGKNPAIAGPFSVEMAKGGRFRVIHACHSLDAATTEIPRLIRGEAVQADSSIASSTDVVNDSSAPGIVPRAVVMGKGFSPEDMEKIIQTGRSTEGGRKVAFCTPDDSKMAIVGMGAAMAGNAIAGKAPTAASVADRVKACLEGHGIVPGSQAKEYTENLSF